MAIRTFETLSLFFVISLAIALSRPGFCDEERDGEFAPRRPASILSVEKMNHPRMIEPGWYRSPGALGVGSPAGEEPIQLLNFSLRKREAPGDAPQSQSVTIEKRLTLRN